LREAILSGEIATVLWLDQPEDRQLRARAIFGDQLGLCTADGALAWCEPDNIRIRRLPNAALILAPYRSNDRLILLHLGRHSRALADAVPRLRRDHTPIAAERKWRQFIGRLGAFPSAEDRSFLNAAEQTVLYRGRSVLARRPLHPSGLIDRLMLRDRCVASEAFERLLCGSAAEASPRLSAR
jgi:hypothetical protein